MVQRDRAFRRFKKSVKKKKVSRYWNANVYFLGMKAQTDKGIIGRVATTPCNCSCWMCGHQRQGHGLTHSEKVDLARADITLGLTEIE